MNLKRLVISTFIFASFTFAQDDFGSFSEETTSETDSYLSSTPPPEPAPEPRATRTKTRTQQEPAAQGKSVFDTYLRGHAYNPYSTQGAATTVTDLVDYPSDIHGQKFFYVSPTSLLGYTAFGLGESSSMLLGLDNSEGGNLAALKLGYANSIFGLSLDLSLAKTWTSDDDADFSERQTEAGDNIGLNFSMPLGSAQIYARVNWLTTEYSYSADYDGDNISEDYSTIAGEVGYVSSIGALNYDVAFGLIRAGGTYNSDADGQGKAVDDTTGTSISLTANLGYVALQNASSRVIVGTEVGIKVKFIDEITGSDKEGDNVITAPEIIPNILGEVALHKNLLAFAGAKHDLTFMYGDGNRDDKSSYTDIRHSNRTEAFTGLKFQKENWSLEAQIAANPFAALNGANIFANFGGFIYF